MTTTSKKQQSLRETYDVFISHSSEDARLSREVMAKLQGHGLTCFHSDFHFTPGKSLAALVCNGIDRSKKTLLLVTQAFVKSDWRIFEEQQAKSKSYKHRKCLLIIILCDISSNNPAIRASTKEFGYLMWDDDSFWPKLLDKIQEDQKMDEVIPAGNVAHGLVWGYFFGYLRFVLKGLPDRIKQSEFWGQKIQIILKMIIIIPRSCFCPAKFADWDTNFSSAGFIQFISCRAGNIPRDYKSPVTKVKDPDSDEEFYFIGEYATPLLSIWEMEQGRVAAMDKDQKFHQMMLFKDKLYDIVNHRNNQDCNNRVMILLYDDETLQKGKGHSLSRAVVHEIRKQLNYSSWAEVGIKSMSLT